MMNNKTYTWFIYKFLICLTVFLFCGCKDNENCECKFFDLDEYIQIKNSWTEPESYSFCYNFAFGDSVVLHMISVVCGENSQIDFGSSADDLVYNNYYKNIFCEDDVCFSTVTDVFDFFYKRWLIVSGKENIGVNISFSVKYKKDKRGYSYPYELIENRESVSAAYSAGYGGVYIKLLNFKD